MTITQPKGALPLFLFLGQSYFGKNSSNGRVLSPPEPNPARMLNGPHQLFGAGAEPLHEPFDGLTAAVDFMPRVQSPVTAFLYRYAARATGLGLPPECIGHSESRSNGSIAHLLPPAHEWHSDSAIFENLMAAVSAAVRDVSADGGKVHVPALFFCQGTGDREMDKASYLARLGALFDALGPAITLRTGQEAPPHYFIVQPPAKPFDGRWPCLQAHLDICETRSDCTLAMAGWAVPQHDRTHFTGAGCVSVGEICAEVYLAALRGEDLSAPRIARARRTGRTIHADIAGAADVIADMGPDTPRHRVGGAPLPHHGLQLDQGEIETVEIEGRTLRITLTEESAPPTILHFAHANRQSLGLQKMKDKANQSLNRGNIRADRQIDSLFLDTPLHQWMASSVHSIETV